ncbi:MAG: DUF1838 family protein [Pseudomonadota bacterium]
MPTLDLLNALPRRSFLVGTSVAVGAAALPGSAVADGHDASTKTSSAFDFEDPAKNVAVMARLAGDMSGERAGHVHYSGRAFGTLPGEPIVPLYGIEGMSSTKTLPVEDGKFRFLFSEFAIYTDLETGKPLSKWTNPYTNETLPVWHQRNGPVNFALSPKMNAFGGFNATQAAPAFRLPWRMIDGTASFALDVTSKRKNPLLPEKWPRESSGATMFVSEHSQYFVSPVDLANDAITDLSFHASLQSNKPWHPWMMMGQQPGGVFARLYARKVPGIEALDPSVAEVASTHLASFVEAPAEWTGTYKTAHSIYAATMQPVK